MGNLVGLEELKTKTADRIDGQQFLMFTT